MGAEIPALRREALLANPHPPVAIWMLADGDAASFFRLVASLSAKADTKHLCQKSANGEFKERQDSQYIDIAEMIWRTRQDSNL